MKPLRISVVVPVYNGEKYLAQCLEMLLAQSYTELEIIVVNDGSMDGTAQVVERYPSIKYLHHSNRGLSATRNRGAEAATGDYIHFLDVDDLINLDFYTHLAAAAVRTDADMVFCGFRNEGRPSLSLLFNDLLLLTADEDKFGVTRAGGMSFAVRYLIKTPFFREHGLQFRNGMFEDIYFTLPALLAAGRVVTVPGATYYYMKRAGSILQSHDGDFERRRNEEWCAAKSFRREFFRTHGISSGVSKVDKMRYKFCGIPVATKEVYSDAAIRWSVFGLRLMTRNGKRV